MDDVKVSTQWEDNASELDKNITDDADFESDDDLLAPIFLYNGRSHTDIHTPSKVGRPQGDNLSPGMPRHSAVVKKEKGKKKKRFSFNQLVNEKSAQDEIDKKLSKMNEELKESIRNGGIFDMILREEGKESDADLSDESHNASDLLPQHKNELDRNIKQMNEGFGNDFPDGFPGESFFIHEEEQVDLTTPKYLKELMGLKSRNRQTISSSYEVDSLTTGFLTSGFLTDLALHKSSIDSSLMDWLLNCICFSSNFEVIEAAFNALWTFTMSTNVQLVWSFSAKKLWKLLTQMGGSDSETSFTRLLEDLLPTEEPVEPSRSDRPMAVDLSFIFVHRLQILLKSYIYFLKQYPERLSKAEIMASVMIALRLSIAQEVNPCSWEFEVLIGCAIDLYSGDDWEPEMLKICQNAIGLTTNHSNKLQMVEIIPVTPRGRDLKKLMAFSMMASITSNSFVDTSMYRNLISVSIVGKILDVVSRIRTNQTTDFHQLFSTISFISHCTPSDLINTADKKNLESLVAALRCLNGDIRDPGGYYLNRTKVKDLIIRTLNRLTHIANGLQTQSSLDSFFGENASSFDQLKFEILEDQPEKLTALGENSVEDSRARSDPELNRQNRTWKEASHETSDDSCTEDELEEVNEDRLVGIRSSVKKDMEVDF